LLHTLRPSTVDSPLLHYTEADNRATIHSGTHGYTTRGFLLVCSQKEMLAALPELVSKLGTDDAAGLAQATAMTTTDLASKSAALTIDVGGVTVSIGGCAKGSGMIHPNMATMLGTVTCDAAVEPALWRQLVRTASTKSFNQVRTANSVCPCISLATLKVEVARLHSTIHKQGLGLWPFTFESTCERTALETLAFEHVPRTPHSLVVHVLRLHV